MPDSEEYTQQRRQHTNHPAVVLQSRLWDLRSNAHGVCFLQPNFQTLQQQHDQVGWEYKKLDQHHNTEPYIEIRLKQDVPLLQPKNTSQNPIHTSRPSSQSFPGWFIWVVSQRVALQTCMCSGRGICEQRSCQDGSSQVFPGWQSHQQEGARELRPV